MKPLVVVAAILVGLGVAALAGYGGFRLVTDDSESGPYWSALQCRDEALSLALHRYNGECSNDPADCFLHQATIDVVCDNPSLRSRSQPWTPAECREARDLLDAMYLRVETADARASLRIAINDHCD